MEAEQESIYNEKLRQLEEEKRLFAKVRETQREVSAKTCNRTINYLVTCLESTARPYQWLAQVIKTTMLNPGIAANPQLMSYRRQH